MLKTRVVPVLLLKGNSIVKTVAFQEPRMVGDAATNVKVFSSRLADEMVILDIQATEFERINYEQIARLAKSCVMPLTVGGGVDSQEKASRIFECGADKVVVCTAFYNNPGLLEGIATRFGAQAAVFSLDAKLVDGRYMAVSSSGRNVENLDVEEAAVMAVESGAGEILLNSVDQDGLMKGYDLDLISLVSSRVSVPVVACGGCGEKNDCVQAVRAGASAVAAGSIFYWVGESILTIKAHMSNCRIEVRDV